MLLLPNDGAMQAMPAAANDTVPPECEGECGTEQYA
jgi:hypothetical protein